MCGRYTLTFIFEDLAEVFNAIVTSLAVPPRFNVAPSQEMPVVTRTNDQNYLQVMRWGLVPAWADNPSIGNRLINARKETLAEKASFRSALISRRCLIPADGYYEWQPIPGQRGRQPYRIVVLGRPVFAFAGLWETWGSKQDELHTFSIITTDAAPMIEGIHDRMPLILPQDKESQWLTGPQPGQSIHQFLDAMKPEANLHAYPVSSVVNSPRHDLPECLLPVSDELWGQFDRSN